MTQLGKSLLVRVKNAFDHENAICIKITCFDPSVETPWPSFPSFRQGDDLCAHFVPAPCVSFLNQFFGVMSAFLRPYGSLVELRKGMKLFLSYRNAGRPNRMQIHYNAVNFLLVLNNIYNSLHHTRSILYVSRNIEIIYISLFVRMTNMFHPWPVVVAQECKLPVRSSCFFGFRQFYTCLKWPNYGI